jgi:hypothetical protein
MNHHASAAGDAAVLKVQKVLKLRWSAGTAGPSRTFARRVMDVLVMAALVCGTAVWAQAPSSAGPGAAPAGASAASAADELFKEAGLALGDKLIAEHRCSECHARRTGGDGSGIYRPQGRINSPQALLSMVERCNTELKLNLFAEEVSAMAAVLQRDFYRFGKAPAVSGARSADS